MILPTPSCTFICSNNSNCWVEKSRWTWHCYRYSAKFSFFECQHQQDYKYKFNGNNKAILHTQIYIMCPRNSM